VVGVLADGHLVPPGPLSDFAEDLEAELVRLGFRMRVRSVKVEIALAAT
jgi:hypothetical protein